MHWLPILLLAALTLAAQTVLVPRCEIAAARPDLLLIVVVFFALHAPPRRAILVGWAIGFLADLMSIERMGLMSLTYAASALLLVSIRDSLFQRGSVAQFFVTLFLGLAIRAAWAVYVQVLYAASIGPLRTIVLSACFTAILAPFAIALLSRAAPLLGVPRRMSGSRRMSFAHV